MSQQTFAERRSCNRKKVYVSCGRKQPHTEQLCQQRKYCAATIAKVVMWRQEDDDGDAPVAGSRVEVTDAH